MSRLGIIPPNISNDGRILGFFKKRNLFEAVGAVVAVVLLYKIAGVFIPDSAKFVFTIVFVILGLGAAGICLIGIGNLSVLEWLMDRQSFRNSASLYPFRMPEKKKEKKRGLFR